jgi:hypothetical protein
MWRFYFSTLTLCPKPASNQHWPVYSAANLQEDFETMVKKLVLGLTLVCFTGALLAADVFTGTWKLNVAKSKFATGTEPKDITAVVAEQGANLAVTVKGTAGDGKPISVKYTVPVKGGAVSYTEGAPATGATVMAKRPNASTMDSASSVNGKEVGSTHAVVSADGKTLTRVVKGMDAQGKAFQNTEVYERQ